MEQQSEPARPGAGQAGDVLARIYQATLHDDAWQRIMELLAPLFGTRKALFMSVDRTHPRDSTTKMIGISPGMGSALRNRDLDQDYLWQWVLRLPTGSVYLSSDLDPGRAYRTGPLYQQIAVPEGMDNVMGVVLENRPEASTCLSFVRPNPGAFVAGDRALLARLAPHLCTALKLSRRVALGDAGRREALRSFDRAGQPVVVLDRSGYALYCNAPALRILGSGSGIALKLGRFLFDNIAVQAEFERAVRLAVAAASEAGSVPAPRELRVPRRGQGSPFAMTVLPCPGMAERAVLPQGAGCLLLLHDIDGAHALPSDQLVSRYGVTTAELRVCESLFRSGNIDLAAAELCLSRNTVRSHLKSIYAKLGAGTQGQLMRKLAALVPMLEGRDDVGTVG